VIPFGRVAASDRVPLGIVLLVMAVLSGFYAFGPLARSEHAGIFLLGPVWFRRIVVGLTGIFALSAGVAMLAM
jgi:hypothetical protein